jgi:nitrous oxidase accessory protein NosD
LRQNNRVRLRLEALEDRAVPAILQVNPAIPTAFHTIQSAINAAQPGDTIDVAHGSYFEDVIIDRSVSLIGQPDPLIHQNPFIVGTGGSGGVEAVVRIANGVSNVTIQNFAIGDGEGQQQVQVGVLIGVGASNVNFNHNVIRKVRNPLVATASPATTDGILIESTAHNITIASSALYDIPDPPGAQSAVGIVVNGASQVNISHTYVNEAADIGFLIQGAATGVNLVGDSVGQTLTGSGIGISVQDSAQVRLHHDKVYQLPGTSIGLRVSGSAQVIGAEDEFTENAFGVQVLAGFTGSLTLGDSYITDNTQAGIDNLSTVLVTATGVWWGDPTGPGPLGLGNPVIGPVNFSGWLTGP